MHAPFFGVCMSVGAVVVPKGRETGAIALVQAGLTIAVMLGVPFGTFIGGVASWRIVFGIIVATGVIVLIGLFKVIPNVSLSSEMNLKQELKVFKNPYFLLVISIVIFGYSGVFTTFINVISIRSRICFSSNSDLFYVWFCKLRFCAIA